MDGAHNSNGVEALRESLVALFPGEKFHFIMGAMADKDYETMIGELLPLAIDFTTCTVECERALQADALADCIRRKGIAAASADDFASCFQRGRLDEPHRTVAFGSLYFIGEIEALFEAKIVTKRLQNRAFMTKMIQFHKLSVIVHHFVIFRL